MWRKIRTKKSNEKQLVQPPIIHVPSTPAYQDPSGILLNCPQENVIHSLATMLGLRFYFILTINPKNTFPEEANFSQFYLQLMLRKKNLLK